MSDAHAEAKEIIAKILNQIGDKPCVFRGTPKEYSKSKDGDGVCSSLYRWGKKEQIWIDEFFSPSDIEKGRVARAKALHFSHNSSNLEVVTALRHFGGKVNAIDFSTDLYVALFFACIGGKPIGDEAGCAGELISIERKKLHCKDEIEYERLPPNPILLTPHYSQVSHSRVIAQKSIFVYSKKGYLSKDMEKYETFSILPEHKIAILEYLREFHGIKPSSIYNDLIGFIQNETNSEKEASFFFIGNAKFVEKKYQDAIKNYTKAIDISPQYAAAFYGRGNAKSALNKHQDAIKDFDKAIQIDLQYVAAYNNRGIAKLELKNYQDAIKDFSKAIQINPQHAAAYNNRGIAKRAIGDEKGAQADFKKARELDPNLQPPPKEPSAS